jgi:hypothetical protein
LSGRSPETNSIFLIDLIDLNPYFHGSVRRIGAPFEVPIGLPKWPTVSIESSFQAWKRLGTVLANPVSISPSYSMHFRFTFSTTAT